MDSTTTPVSWRTFRITSVLVAVSVGAAAIWGPLIGIGSADHMGVTRWLALLASLMLLAVAWSGRRIARIYATTALILLNMIVALIVVELGSAVVLVVIDRSQVVPVNPQERRDPASTSPYYAGRPWAAEYWREFGVAARHYRYHPYFLWRMAPFEGSLIRVDSAGVRVTPGANCGAGAYRVWFFGGSTAWGLGAPDDGTIPSHLQRLLAAGTSQSVCVVNFGQLGFVTTQDVVQLGWELLTGKRPDLVIFYEGNNDVVTAFQYNHAGLHWNLPSLTRKLETPVKSSGPLDLRSLLTRSNAYRLAKRLTRAGRGSPPDKASSYRYEGYFDSDTLADAVVATYLENLRIVRAIGLAYHFQVAFFWQPTVLLGAKPLTEVERSLREREPMGPFMRKVYARVHSKAPSVAGLYDLADVFAQDSSLAYIDSHHLTPEANATVAEAILNHISQEGPSDREASSGRQEAALRWPKPGAGQRRRTLRFRPLGVTGLVDTGASPSGPSR